MKKQLLLLVLCLGITWSHYSFALEFSDSAGDAQGPDITAMSYQVVGDALEMRLTFVQPLEGSVINQDMHAFIGFDIDRSLMTGFTSGSGLHSQFGVDYEIELFLMGFGLTSNEAVLKYWQHKSNPPFIQLEKVSIALGNSFYPNGSVFVVGKDLTYGTNSHQIFLRVPLNLFSNTSFPLCSVQGSMCINNYLFPCPLDFTHDPTNAYVNVMAVPVYFGDSVDMLPDNGMLNTATGAVKEDYPMGPKDLVIAVTDSPQDCFGGICNNGEELTEVKAFVHEGGNLTFELKIATYSFEDTAVYLVLMDLDNNPATGEPYFNGEECIGIDLLAEYYNFNNPIGEANPLAGNLYFRVDDGYCPLLYIDYLANVWRSSPGYIWITIPEEFLAPYLASNPSGAIMAMVGSFSPDVLFTGFADTVPDQGFLKITNKCN